MSVLGASFARQGARDRRLRARVPGRDRSLTIDARIVIASVDTYLRFAEAVNRLDLTAQAKGLPEIVEELLAEPSGRSKERSRERPRA